MDTMLCYEYGTSVFEAMEAAAVQCSAVAKAKNINSSQYTQKYNIGDL